MTLRQAIFIPFGLVIATLFGIVGIVGLPIFAFMAWMDRSDSILADVWDTATFAPRDIITSGWERYGD